MSWIHVVTCAYFLVSFDLTEAQSLTCPSSPTGRTNCGVAGISQAECESGGANTLNRTRCCFDSSCSQCPWCYYSADLIQYTCPLDNPTARSACGNAGISQANCNAGIGTYNSQKCCWDSSVAVVPWCYLPTVLTTAPKTATSISAHPSTTTTTTTSTSAHPTNTPNAVKSLPLTSTTALTTSPKTTNSVTQSIITTTSSTSIPSKSTVTSHTEPGTLTEKNLPMTATTTTIWWWPFLLGSILITCTIAIVVAWSAKELEQT